MNEWVKEWLSSYSCTTSYTKNVFKSFLKMNKWNSQPNLWEWWSWANMRNSVFLSFWHLFYYNSSKIEHDIFDSTQFRLFKQPNCQFSTNINKGKCTINIKKSISTESCKVPNIHSISFWRAEGVTFMYSILLFLFPPSSFFLYLNTWYLNIENIYMKRICTFNALEIS